MQKRRTLRRTLLQYQRDCQSLDAATTGGASNTVNPVEPSKLAMMSRAGGQQAMALPASSHQSAAGPQATVDAVSLKTVDAHV